MNKEFFIIGILITLCLFLWFWQQFLVDNLYTNSYNLPQTEQKIHSIRLANQALRNQILERSSYREIYEKAIKQGFVPAEKIINL